MDQKKNREFDVIQKSNDNSVGDVQGYKPDKVPKVVQLVQERKFEQIPDKFLLDNKMRSDFVNTGPRCPEDLAFSASMRACLDYLGEDYGHMSLNNHWRLDRAYTFFMGISGEAFGSVLTPEPVKGYDSVFNAKGYEYEILFKNSDYYRMFSQDIQAFYGEQVKKFDNEGYIRELIADHLSNNQRPVIALGLLEPPQGCVVVGYNNYGEELVGWNFLPDYSPNPKPKYINKKDWYKDIYAVILVGEKHESPEFKSTYIKALQEALEYLQMNQTKPIPLGLNSFENWEKALVDDEKFVEDNSDSLREQFNSLVVPNVWDFAERRWYAARFIEQAIEYLPEPNDELTAAMHCFDAEHDMMYEFAGMIDHAPGRDVNLKKLADPQIRRGMAEIIHQCYEKDIEAVKHIEKALKKVEN